MSGQDIDLVRQPYLLDTGLSSRSISFENSTGAPGQGGQAASRLGGGRKGSHSMSVEAGTTVVLADIKGPGTIRHIWLTLADPSATASWQHKTATFRNFAIRAYWDNQPHPSIECPAGDFFGFGHGRVVHYQSAVHSVAGRVGMNLWLPMPFRERAKITITNEADYPISVVYTIDHTIGDKHPENVGRMHALFRRENPTTPGQDFELLPKREGKGRYIGSVISVRQLSEDWWGEGEFKVYMDGDTKFPTICGTGSEDWAGLSHGLSENRYVYHGGILSQGKFHAMYRWHLPDPIAWQNDCRITMQQIAWRGALSETKDDWSTATFWYEPLPSAPLPPMPDVAARTADLWRE